MVRPGGTPATAALGGGKTDNLNTNRYAAAAADCWPPKNFKSLFKTGNLLFSLIMLNFCSKILKCTN